MNLAAGNSHKPLAVSTVEGPATNARVVAVSVDDSHGEVPIYDVPPHSFNTVPPLYENIEQTVSASMQTKPAPVDTVAPHGFSIS